MAPRGRPRKRDTRMAAAIEATSEMGFPEGLVRDTVKDLLKVYGGNDGWRFIEEGSYKLLIEVLLEKQQDGGAENGDAAPQPQDEAAPQPEEDAAPLDDDAPVDDAVPLDDAEASAAVPSSTIVLPTCSNLEVVDNTFQIEDASDSASHTNGAKPASLPKIPDSLAPQRRRPCYGWICSNNEEDPIELTPAPWSEWIKLLIKPDEKRKRKSRWDVRPGDV